MEGPQDLDETEEEKEDDYKTRPYGLPHEQEGATYDVWCHILEHVSEPEEIENLWGVSLMFQDILRPKYEEMIKTEGVTKMSTTIVTFRLKQGNPAVDAREAVEKLNAEIMGRFRSCALTNQNEDVLEYHIETTTVGLGMMHKFLEDLKRTYGDVTQFYSICESYVSLKDILLKLARSRCPSRVKVRIPLWKRILTCQCCCSN